MNLSEIWWESITKTVLFFLFRNDERKENTITTNEKVSKYVESLDIAQGDLQSATRKAILKKPNLINPDDIGMEWKEVSNYKAYFLHTRFKTGKLFGINLKDSNYCNRPQIFMCNVSIIWLPVKVLHFTIIYILYGS